MNFEFKKIICIYGLYRYPIILYLNGTAYVISVDCNNYNSIDEAVKESKEREIYCPLTHEIVQNIITEN